MRVCGDRDELHNSSIRCLTHPDPPLQPDAHHTIRCTLFGCTHPYSFVFFGCELMEIEREMNRFSAFFLNQPPAVETDSNGVARYEVECVLAQRGAAGRRELLVRWKGYGAEDDQWQPRSQLIRTAAEAVADFDSRQAMGA